MSFIESLLTCATCTAQLTDTNELAPNHWRCLHETIAKDSNGTVLNTGDSVSVIKDLDVKGTQFVAKRGTVVKNISLTDNPEYIEGRVNGVKLVLKSVSLKV